MKNKNYIYRLYVIGFLSIISIIALLGSSNNSDSLAIAIMVKNEEGSLVETLEPYAQAGIGSILVYDTGSTDKTVEVAQKFFETYNLKEARIIEEPFIDFAASRNKALEHAEEIFPQCTFILMPDAEWYIKNAPELVEFCKAAALNPAHPSGFLVHITCPTLDFYTPRLVSANHHVRFIGKVHEIVCNGDLGKVPAHIYFDYRPSSYGREKSLKRWERDRDLLLQEYQEDPSNSRIVFYLAQTYLCLGDAKNACKYYTIRANMAGWDEENFITWYRLGQAYAARLNENDSEVTWKDAYDCYYKAFTLRPHRVESLIAIAEYYLKQDDFFNCYIHARYATEIEYPKNDVLFVDKYLYDFVRWDLLSRSAWYVKQYDVGERALCKALMYDRKAPHLWNNLNHYLDR